MAKKKTITKRISRAKVIEALKTEPLDYGAWFHGNDIKTCNVCAVGAVIRKASFVSTFSNFDEEQMGNICLKLTDRVASACDVNSEDETNSAIKILLEDENYLGALSVFFEDMMDRDTTGVVNSSHRKRLVTFVKKHFPQLSLSQ